MIQTIFKSAYEMLCSTPTDSNVTEIQNYLFKLDLPTTDTNLSEALTSMKELDNISKLKANKSPGSDGAFPLTGHLRLLSIPVIPKEGRNKDYCETTVLCYREDGF